MPLPEPAPRRHLHTRTVTYRGFLREDDLWDIEGEITDVKPYDFTRSDGSVMHAGTPVHNMVIRVTMADDMVIRAIAASTNNAPFAECQQGVDPMQRMVGERMGPGWRQAIEKHLGNARGCTHLREMLFNMATAAFQTVFAWRDREKRKDGAGRRELTQPPYHLGRCIAWDFDGAVTARSYPQFIGWVRGKPPVKPPETPKP